MRRRVAVIGIGMALGAVALAQSLPVGNPTGVQPITLAGERVAAEVTGLTGGPVVTSGTVSLTPESIAALGPAPCTQGETQRIAVGSTPLIVPPNLPDGGSGALSGRTGILIINADNIQKVSCRADPGDGGVPDCTTPGYGLTLYPNGGSASFSAGELDPIRCVACVGVNIPVEYQEEACARQ